MLREINEGLVQSKQEVISEPRKGTDWNKQPIGYVFAGAGIGYIPSVEKVEGLAASNYVTGLDWRVGMSRYYNRWGWEYLYSNFVPSNQLLSMMVYVVWLWMI